jgi:hypothetical protein
MIARVVWIAALIGIALVTIALQVDKQSEVNGALAELVPGPLRNYAQTQITRKAIQEGDAATALTEAKRLVRRRPVPAEYLTLLAGAQVKAGQSAEALTTIQIAGQRGWREPKAQEAVLLLALGAGDKAEAARRYAALFLRGATPDSLLAEVGPSVLGAPQGEGQQTMTAIVVGGERWHDQFLRRGPKVMPPEAFAAIASDSLARGAAFNCSTLEISIRQLRRRDAASSQRLAAAASARCPQLARMAAATS